MTEVTYIYALTDPRTEEVRYIGKTINEPLFRLGKHLEEARGNVRGYKNNWIRSLLLLGLEPDVSVLEIVFYPDGWQERERWWIAFAREQGFRLTNVSGGGEAGGYARTEETKRKISEANGKPYPAFIHKETGKIIPAGVNQRAACKKWGLCTTGMSTVIFGRQHSHRGWILLKEEK